jgi:cytidylate kinase
MTVIAMTREIGSRGTDVAAGVAAELGLEIINSEIVVPHVAGSLGLEQSAVQRIWTARRLSSTVGRSIRGSCRNIRWTKFSIWL